MDFARAIATAQRLIAANGQVVGWRKPAAAAVGADPWRDVRDGDPPPDTPVSIVWVPPKLRTLAFLQNVPKSEVPDGVELALMGAVDFEPELTDNVVVDGTALALYRLDVVKPNGTPVLYTLWIKR